jgi:ankyrin repeat protein
MKLLLPGCAVIFGCGVFAFAAADADQRLLEAAREGSAPGLSKALADGADPNARDDAHRPALVVAAASRRRDAVDALLAAGADPRLQDHTWTPLLIAVLQHDLVLIDRLLAAGAPVNAWDARQTTPLMLAAGLGHEEIVARLLKAEGAWAEALDKEGATALHYAANNGNLDVVRLLVPRLGAGGADQHGNTPLALAERHGFDDVVEYLKGVPPVSAK